jgi:Rieske 2Fe-2S family protein
LPATGIRSKFVEWTQVRGMTSKSKDKPTAGKTTKGRLSGDEDFDGLGQSVKSLPADWYFDPDWYRHELERVFYDNWLYLCHASTLAEKRAFRRFRIGTQEIFVLRDDQGMLRGFHNSCRHRGSILCQQEAGRLRGKLIVCPYHQWAYGLDGELKAISSRHEPPDFDKADFPLHAVAFQEWRGGIFVSLAEDPPELKSGFERGSDRIDHWPMESLEVGHRWSNVMQCNWKIFWENFNECLHCPNIHPELCELVPIYGRRISGVRDAPDWQDYRDSKDPKYAGGLREGARSWSTSGQACGPPFPELTPAEIARGQSYFVSLPSVFIACHADYMRTVRILPLGPEQTEIEVEWLFQPQTLARDDFNLADVTDFAILVMQQDAEASELNQQGLHARKFGQGVLMPEEHYVKSFQDWVRAQTS